MRKWIYPANPKYYDLLSSFHNEDKIIWPMATKVEIGDHIYFYLSSPQKQIQYLCEVLETKIDKETAFIQNEKYTINKSKNKTSDFFIYLKLIKKYDEDRALTFDILKNNGLKDKILAPINLQNYKFLMYYLETFN